MNQRDRRVRLKRTFLIPVRG